MDDKAAAAIAFLFAEERAEVPEGAFTASQAHELLVRELGERAPSLDAVQKRLRLAATKGKINCVQVRESGYRVNYYWP